LLGYYFGSRFKSAEAKQAGREHVLWVIKNRPEAEIAGLPYCQIDAIIDPDGYRQAKQLWLDQAKAKSDSAAILGHAANFFIIHDKSLAEDLFKQAQKLEPDDPRWPEQLGHFYALQKGKDAAAKSLAELEKAQSTDPSAESKLYRLAYLAKSAFNAGQTEKASQYAKELLESGTNDRQDWNYGNAIHHGNTILGRLALRNGNAKQADEYLLKAGKTPGSPQLNSFGPNMALAKDLLEAGEKESILEYFDLCRTFWKMGGDRLDTWTTEVKAGKVPDFGANLAY
jgi:tetratricopeptide (TPR) repeat protein